MFSQHVHIPNYYVGKPVIVSLSKKLVVGFGTIQEIQLAKKNKSHFKESMWFIKDEKKIMLHDTIIFISQTLMQNGWQRWLGPIALGGALKIWHCMFNSLQSGSRNMYTKKHRYIKMGDVLIANRYTKKYIYTKKNICTLKGCCSGNDFGLLLSGLIWVMFSRNKKI